MNNECNFKDCPNEGRATRTISTSMGEADVTFYDEKGQPVLYCDEHFEDQPVLYCDEDFEVIWE